MTPTIQRLSKGLEILSTYKADPRIESKNDVFGHFILVNMPKIKKQNVHDNLMALKWDFNPDFPGYTFSLE